MNSWSLLAVINEYPKLRNKETREIRMRCVNLRHAKVPGSRPQTLTAEIPVYAFGATAEALRSLLKLSRHIIFQGRIEIGKTGLVRLVATTFTHLPGSIQTADSYITELYKRNEVLESAELPIYDLLQEPGDIAHKYPDDTGEREWQTPTS